MGDKHERHVLLTAWSTVNPNLIKDGLELENIYVEEFGTEFEDIKKSVVTSESALKYLVVPREKVIGLIRYLLKKYLHSLQRL